MGDGGGAEVGGAGGGRGRGGGAGGGDLPHPSTPALGPAPQPPIQWYKVIPGGKAAGAWR